MGMVTVIVGAAAVEVMDGRVVVSEAEIQGEVEITEMGWICLVLLVWGVVVVVVVEGLEVVGGGMEGSCRI